MQESVLGFKFVKLITIVSLFGNNNLISARISKTQLSNIVAGVLNFGSTILGNNFTENDESLFDRGSHLEEVHLEIDKMIRKYGYAVEKYEVMTEDGYILTLFRIPSSGRPIFLMHGLFMSADDWVTPGPQSGLAYLLAAEGFDVWLGNARGSKYSRRHLYLSPESTDFWDFSWHEMGCYDLPVMIDFIISTTRHNQLIYVGHSQGTTNFFVMGSERPEYSKKISLMVALAPAGAVPNLKSPILRFIIYATYNQPALVFALLRNIGLNELMQKKSSSINSLFTDFATVFCANSEIARAICSNLVFVMCGFSYNQLNITNLPVVLSHLSSGVSTKQIEHYAQTVTFRKFQQFDYGMIKNKVLYGSIIPPEYDVGAIPTPVGMFYSADDWLASERDVHILRDQLNNVVDFYRVPDKTFKHIDFLYAKDIRKIVFARMLKLIKSH